MSMEQDARDMGRAYVTEGIEPTAEDLEADWREAQQVHGLLAEQRDEFINTLLAEIER